MEITKGRFLVRANWESHLNYEPRTVVLTIPNGFDIEGVVITYKRSKQ
jgi:hypothetical protein